MCRRLILRVLLVILAGCNLAQSDSITPIPTPDLPVVEILSPVNNRQIFEGTEFDIDIVARDTNPGIGRVELFIDGNDLPLIYKDRKVRLQFEGWPAIQLNGWPSVAIGSFGGVVSSVDPYVAQNGVFRVMIEPDPEEEVEWPGHNTLRQGARVVGIVVLDQVSVGYEIWRQVNGFPKSMPKAPNKITERAEK